MSAIKILFLFFFFLVNHVSANEMYSRYLENGSGIIAAALEEEFRRPPFPLNDNNKNLRFYLKIKKFYQNSNYLPVWVLASKDYQGKVSFSLTPHAYSFVFFARKFPQVVNNLKYKRKLNTYLIGKDLKAGKIKDIVATELMLADLFTELSLDYLRDDSHYRDSKNPTAINFIAAQKKRIPGTSVSTAIAKFLPEHWQYWLLAQAKLRYEKLLESGGVPRLPYVDELYYGMVSDKIPKIREYLIKTGHLSANTEITNQFDWILEEAVKLFEFRHGMEVDGIIDRDFIRTANISLKTRLKQIILNINRWLDLPVQMEDEYLFVNVPEYRLHAVRNGEKKLEMNVVVGKKTHMTELFTDQMSYLVINPYWYLPPSIIREELIDLVAKEPGYLRKYDFEILTNAGWRTPSDDFSAKKLASYQVRQKPGKHNTLGKVKFMFPNNHSIYIHDTNINERHLFEESMRAHSHGCVRASKPLELANFLLSPQGYSSSAIEAIINKGKLVNITLSKPIKVYISYFTVFVDTAGGVNFRPDIYGLDKISLY